LQEYNAHLFAVEVLPRL